VNEGEWQSDGKRRSHCSEVLDTEGAPDELYYHPELATLSCVVWYVDCCYLGIYLGLIHLCWRGGIESESVPGELLCVHCERGLSGSVDADRAVAFYFKTVVIPSCVY